MSAFPKAFMPGKSSGLPDREAPVMPERLPEIYFLKYNLIHMHAIA
jgi:hypothetical protein